MRDTPSKALALVLAVLLATLFGFNPAAGAQDDDLPTGPPSDTTETDTDGGGINLELDEVVDCDTDTCVFRDPIEDPTNRDDLEPGQQPNQGEGISGEGTIGGAANSRETAGSTDAAVDEPAAGGSGSESGSSGVSRNSMFVIAGLLGLAVVGLFVYRARSGDEVEDEDTTDWEQHMETVLPSSDPNHPQNLQAPAYAGAAEGGAYDQGGAAYAQYTEPGSPEMSTEKGSFKDQLVNFADQKLTESGKQKLLAGKLQRAGSNMRPGEWLLFAIGGTLIGLIVGFIVFGWFLAILIGIFVAMGFWAMLGRGAEKRESLFADQLPETLGLLSGSLRAGMSMIQAVQTVAEEADEPTAGEFQRVITEVRLGRDVAHSFRDMSERMRSEDFEWVVSAVEINNEVGGDLSVILDRVGNTIRARNRVRGQVKALSAEGRASGMVLFCLPPAMTMLIAVSNRGYLDEMITTTPGQIVLGVAMFLLLCGGAWLKRLCRFVY